MSTYRVSPINTRVIESEQQSDKLCTIHSKIYAIKRIAKRLDSKSVVRDLPPFATFDTIEHAILTSRFQTTFGLTGPALSGFYPIFPIAVRL